MNNVLKKLSAFVLLLSMMLILAGCGSGGGTMSNLLSDPDSKPAVDAKPKNDVEAVYAAQQNIQKLAKQLFNSSGKQPTDNPSAFELHLPDYIQVTGSLMQPTYGDTQFSLPYRQQFELYLIGLESSVKDYEVKTDKLPQSVKKRVTTYYSAVLALFKQIRHNLEVITTQNMYKDKEISVSLLAPNDYGKFTSDDLKSSYVETREILYQLTSMLKTKSK